MPVERRKDVLHSWKDIASFLQRGVRTVQRWEKQHNLPVHRVGAGVRAPTFAFRSELQAWLVHMAETAHSDEFRIPEPAATEPIGKSSLGNVRRLGEQSRELRERVRRSREVLHSRMKTLQNCVSTLLETGQHAAGKPPKKKGPGPAAA